MEHDAESSKRYKENWDDAVQASKADAAEIAELKAAYALLFKAHGAEHLTVDRLHDRLRQIGDRAHDASTGPAVPDVLWEIRSMEHDADRYRKLRAARWIDDSIMTANDIIEHDPSTLDAAVDRLPAVG